MKIDKAKLPQQAIIVDNVGSSGRISVELSTIKRASLTVRALYHPLRKAMLEIMQDQENITVTELYKKLKIDQSKCSLHLKILRKAELVHTKRTGKQIGYSINGKRIAEVYELAILLAQRSI